MGPDQGAIFIDRVNIAIRIRCNDQVAVFGSLTLVPTFGLRESPLDSRYPGHVDFQKIICKVTDIDRLTINQGRRVENLLDVGLIWKAPGGFPCHRINFVDIIQIRYKNLVLTSADARSAFGPWARCTTSEH